jgi:predicted lipoprotein with Yx(FWY)xxD motif
MTPNEGAIPIMRRLFLVVAPAAVVAVAVAGCGGGGSSTSTTSTSTATSSKAHAATVSVRKTGLGTILVDSSGHTLYLFEKDKGDKSSCAGACASAWPPVITTAKPMPGAGVSAAKLGTTRRSDGTMEATYNGHPLYTYAGDAAPGDTTGEGLDQFGAEWYALSPHGNKVEKSGS